MKKIVLTVFLVLALGWTAAASASGVDGIMAQRGRTLEDFSVATIDGGTFSLSEALREKRAVLINLWASWCGPCGMEFPMMQQVYEQYRDRVEYIALSVEAGDSAAALKAYAGARGLTFPIGSDKTVGLAGQFAYVGIPATLVVDRFGTIVYIKIGAELDETALPRLFDALVGDDYTESRIFDKVPAPLPAVEKPEPAALAEALGAGDGVAFFCSEDPAVWPMTPAEHEGRRGVASTNQGTAESVSSLLVRVTARAGDALAFDFALSTEAVSDLLTISVDGRPAKAFGGEHEWTAWALPLEEGDHTVSFSYAKDESVDEGRDTVWLSRVRLVGGDEAREMLAALPEYPASDENALVLLTPGAREIRFTGDDQGLMDANYGMDAYWIVPGDEAAFALSAREDADPERAYFYSSYDRRQLSLAQVLDPEGTEYTVSTPLHSIETTGYVNTNVYFFPYGGQGEDAVAYMLFSGEENLNAAVESLRRSIPALDWEYAEEAPAAREEAPAGERAYRVLFRDQEGEAVPGCIVNFCTDSACMPVAADEQGVALFTGAPDRYHLQVLRVPSGYRFDTEQEFYMDETGGEMILTLVKE